MATSNNSAKSIVLWLPRQIVGVIKNYLALITDTGLNDILPEAWVSTLIFIRDSFPRSLGFASNPQEQLINVLVFTVGMVVASLTTLTYVAVGYFLIFFPLALLRFWPVVDKNWPLSPKSWPLWTVSSEGA